MVPTIRKIKKTFCSNLINIIKFQLINKSYLDDQVYRLIVKAIKICLVV